MTDQLGSVRAVVDVLSGAIVQEIEYDAWGNATLVAGTWDVQPFGFAGGLYDSDTGLVRFGARDYDAEVGRWTSKDPALFGGRTSLLYKYAENDPVNWRDPTGEVPQPIVDYFCGVAYAGALVACMNFCFPPTIVELIFDAVGVAPPLNCFSACMEPADQAVEECKPKPPKPPRPPPSPSPPPTPGICEIE